MSCEIALKLISLDLNGGKSKMNHEIAGEVRQQAYTRANADQDLSSHIDGLVYERCNFSASAMELRLSCTNPSISCQRPQMT